MAVILPVVQVMLVVTIGFILARKFDIHQKTLSRLTLYIFVPALVFKGLYFSQMQSRDFLSLTGAFILLMIVLYIFSELLSRFLGLSSEKKSAVNLGSTLINAGNMGIPMVIYAFGDQASGQAVLVFVLSNFFLNSFGVYTASRGRREWYEALKTVIRMPALYAAVLALILNVIGYQLPPEVTNPIVMLSGATIPVVLILLGAQMAEFSGMRNLPLVFSVGIVRLILSPFLAWCIVTFMGLPPFLAKIFILQTSMPTAVNAVIIAIEFDADALTTAGVTFFTTVCSIITIPVLLSLLIAYY